MAGKGALIVRLWLAASVVTGAVLAGIAAGESGAPASTAEVDELIQQLDSDQWAQRQAAQKKLIEMGPGIREHLQAALAQTDDPQIRTELELVLSQVALNERIGQTLVTLNLKDVSAEEAFEELMRQAGAPLVVQPETLWKQRQVSVSIDMSRQPFWEAFRELGRQAGITVREQRSANGLVLQAGDIEPLMGPTVHSGPLMIVLRSAERRSSVDYSNRGEKASLTLNMRVYVEPKLRVYGRTYGAELEQATDEQGNSLLAEAPAAPAGLSNDRAQVFPVVIRLAQPPVASQKIALLKGHIKLAAMVRSETLEVNDLFEVESQSHQVGPHQVLLRCTSKAPNEFEIRVTVFRGAGESYWDRAIDAKEILVYDAQGQQLSATNSTSSTGNQVENRLTIRMAGKNAKLGPPARLEWTLPVAIRELSIPFEFRDLELP